MQPMMQWCILTAPTCTQTQTPKPVWNWCRWKLEVLLLPGSEWNSPPTLQRGSLFLYPTWGGVIPRQLFSFCFGSAELHMPWLLLAVLELACHILLSLLAAFFFDDSRFGDSVATPKRRDNNKFCGERLWQLFPDLLALEEEAEGSRKQGFHHLLPLVHLVAPSDGQGVNGFPLVMILVVQNKLARS